MTTEQILAIKCAFADLIGSLTAELNPDESHDWDAHEQSIRDLINAFPELQLSYDY